MHNVVIRRRLLLTGVNYPVDGTEQWNEKQDSTESRLSSCFELFSHINFCRCQCHHHHQVLFLQAFDIDSNPSVVLKQCTSVVPEPKSRLHMKISL